MRSLILPFVLISISSVSAYVADKPIPVEISKYLAKQGPVIEQKAFEDSTKNQLVVYFCVDQNLPGGKNEGASNFLVKASSKSSPIAHWLLF